MVFARAHLGETRDLAADEPQQARELKRELDAWRQQVGANVPTVNQTTQPK
jgi:hypothetical protein